MEDYYKIAATAAPCRPNLNTQPLSKSEPCAAPPSLCYHLLLSVRARLHHAHRIGLIQVRVCRFQMSVT